MAAAKGQAVGSGVVRVPRVKVRALRQGYYNHERKRVGDVFTLDAEKDFSDVWMTRVDASTPEHTTPGVEMLRREQEDIRRRRAPESTEGSPGIVTDEDAPTGDRAVLGD